jgi:RimJ/RimL family protein N-acetyltransferase
MNDSNVFTFRDIELHDEAGLFKLRNNPSNLEFFKNPSPVSSGDHAKWFASRLTDFKEHQIVAVLSNQLVGIVFLVEIDRYSCSISININSEYQSQGIGQELLTRMLLRVDSLKFTRIEAVIHVANTKSVSLFEKCGFAFEEMISELFIRYVRFTSQNILK